MSSCNHDGKISIPWYGKPWCKYNGQVMEVTKRLRFDKILCMEMQLLPSHRIASHKLLQIIKISSQSVGRKSLFPSFCSRLPWIVSDYFKNEKTFFCIIFCQFVILLDLLDKPYRPETLKPCQIFMNFPKSFNSVKILSILFKFFGSCQNSLGSVKKNFPLRSISQV